jgi:hypothetical protein
VVGRVAPSKVVIRLPLALTWMTIGLAWPALSGAATTKGDDTTKRPLSPKVAEMLAAVAPKYEPPTGAEGSVPAVTSFPELPANRIVRLPQYLVRAPRVPTADEVMTRSEREKFAMQRFLGDETSLDRTLNMISIAGLWAKIPVFGKYPFIVGQYSGRDAGLPVGPRTNEQRALTLLEREEFARKLAGLSSLLSPALKPPAGTGDQAVAAPASPP